MASFFVSDTHLCPEREHAVRRFLEFLEACRGSRALYILGDLFEAWAGDDDLDDPFNRRICLALRALSASTPTYFMPGNRDFLAGERFHGQTGMIALADPAVIELGGVRTVLLHGDTLCTADQPYLEFRSQVRSGSWQREFLARPLEERKRVVESLRTRSELEKSAKSAQIMDADSDAVEDCLRSTRCDRMIHGHTHRPARHAHRVDGRSCERWVLPDWYETGGYLRCDDSGCRLVSF